jgi:hypothetical protein
VGVVVRTSPQWHGKRLVKTTTFVLLSLPLSYHNDDYPSLPVLLVFPLFVWQVKDLPILDFFASKEGGSKANCNIQQKAVFCNYYFSMDNSINRVHIILQILNVRTDVIYVKLARI